LRQLFARARFRLINVIPTPVGYSVLESCWLSRDGDRPTIQIGRGYGVGDQRALCALSVFEEDLASRIHNQIVLWQTAGFWYGDFIEKRAIPYLPATAQVDTGNRPFVTIMGASPYNP
jgi:hypothetical protein